MATRSMAQDIMLCNMCETSPAQMHCNSCATDLCNGCVIKHISADTEKDHNMVLFKKKNTKPIFPSCKTHNDQHCEMKCQQCDSLVCVKCIASGSHIKHNILELLELCNSEKQIIKQKTTELETSTYTKYAKAVSDLETQLQNLPQTYDNLMSEISHQGEEWHREVEMIINQRKQEVQKMKTDDLTALRNLLQEMKNLLSTLHQAILDNKEILKSNNVTQVLDSKFSSPELWNPPPSTEMTPPSFTPLPIQGIQLSQMFGTLTAASMLWPSSPTKLVVDTLPVPIKQLKILEYPESSSSTDTNSDDLLNITCVSPDQVWVSGSDRKIKRLTIPGSLQETVTTTTRSQPCGITVNTQRELIYTDQRDRSINRVINGQPEKIISLKQGWRPLRVCCTDSDDLLVTMGKPSTPSRVVRYSGSKEKQVIQFDDQGKPLFSSDNSGYISMFIADSSNKNMVCVSDWKANAVVVVSQAGKLRFRYAGNLSSQKYKSFSPYGVVIDSMGHILVADLNNHCIHITDLKGRFICYIDNCQLSTPIDLSLDRDNTLYVAECNTAKVKVIKYLT